jgi:hypothetical protein
MHSKKNETTPKKTAAKRKRTEPDEELEVVQPVDKEKENDYCPPFKKIAKTEKCFVQRSLHIGMLETPLGAADFTFLAPEGSTNHAMIKFYVTKPDHQHVHVKPAYRIATPRKLAFGVTRFQGQGAYAVKVPLSPDLRPEDKNHLDRCHELEDIAQAYLLSALSADAWEQVGFQQPKTLEELKQHWSSPVNSWVGKRTGKEYTDIRLKFYVNFQGHDEYVATMCSGVGADKPADLKLIGKNDLISGDYGYSEIFLRRDDSKKFAPYHCGITAYAADVRFEPNPDAQTVYLD